MTQPRFDEIDIGATKSKAEVTTSEEANNNRVAKPSIHPYMRAQLKGTKGVDED